MMVSGRVPMGNVYVWTTLEEQAKAQQCLELLIHAYRAGGEYALAQAVAEHVPPSSLPFRVSQPTDYYHHEDVIAPIHLFTVDSAFLLNPTYQKVTMRFDRARHGYLLTEIVAKAMIDKYSQLLQTDEIADMVTCFVKELVAHHGFDNALDAYRAARAEANMARLAPTA